MRRVMRGGVVVVPVLAAAAAALTGCGTREPERPAAVRSAEPVVELAVARSAAIERAVQEQRGKVVFIKFWGTT